MSITVTQYTTKRVSSKRTHEETIDINVDNNRIFLSDKLARDLIGMMHEALATPFDRTRKELD